MPSRVFALLAVAAIALAVSAYRLNHDRTAWSADGPIYLRMALQDRGLSAEDARRAANRFALTETTLATDPESAGFFSDSPPAFYRDQAALFVTRPLYPALGALLLPRFGPFGLKIVSAAAFVAAIVLMYALLLTFAPPWIAALGAVALALTPNVQGLAGLALTDALGLCFWIASLAALSAYLRAPEPRRLALLIVAVALLTFTRPAIYLPFGAALAVFLTAPRATVLRAAAGRATLAIAAVGVIFGAYTLLAHGPGIASQLHWQYDWQRAVHGRFANRGFGAWWLLSVATAFVQELVVDIYKNNMLLTVALAAFGVVLARRSTAVALAAGAGTFALFAILVNPLELSRTVTVPLMPVLIVLATIALAALAERASTRQAAA
jgi:4-amino-4-deoxy-L-arabinose transferase-like glycosyltransferase